MHDFTIYNPTKVLFGKNIMHKLADTIKQYGNNVLLVYGKGSILKNGIYEQITKQLSNAGINYCEYSGIRSNPIVEDVDEAAEVGRKHNVDCILAVGGGSVIDSAKIISITIPAENKAWDFYTQKAKPSKAIPLVAVLTLAATGTEMNPFAVLQNEAEQAKIGYGHPLCYPAISFLDPQLTYTVPTNYTAFGVADIIAHCFEAYFGAGECTLSDKLIFSIIKDTVEWTPKLMKNLNGYNERAAIMYNATMALNGQIAYGKINTDWGVHALGHTLSLLYGVPHGASLSIMFPAWMQHFKDQLKERIELLGKNIFGTTSANETIEAFKQFFKSIGSPITLTEVGVKQADFEKIIGVLAKNNATGNNIKMQIEDYQHILNIAL